MALLLQESTSSTKTTTTTKNVPYTKTGDKGTSRLATGQRLSKDDDTFEAMGTVDELCSLVGVVHAEWRAYVRESVPPPQTNNNSTLQSSEVLLLPLDDWLMHVMSRLFDIGSHIAKPRHRPVDDHDDPNNYDGIGGGLDPLHVHHLEDWIDTMTEALPELTSFVLPTGAPLAAHLHVARTVCRRAERRMVPLVVDEATCDPTALQYVNRLSDFLFVAARYVNFVDGQEEVQYQRSKEDTTLQKQRRAVPRSLQQD